MIYLIVFFLIIYCVYAYDYRKYPHFQSLTYWGFFVALVVIAGLRYRIGIDSIIYENYYDEMPAFWELEKFKFDSTRLEPGFMIFASIPKAITSDFTLLQFFEAFVVNFVIFWFIKKNTPHKFLALSLYVIALYLNLTTQVIREALAVALFLLAWPYFRDGKWLWYYLLCLVATTIHTSALLTLLLPLACLPGVRQLFKLGWRTFFICIAIIALGFVIQTRFKDFFMMMAMNDRMAGRAEAYSNVAAGGSVLNLFGIIHVFILYCLYPLLSIFFLRYKMKDVGNEEERTSFNKLEIVVMTGIYFTMLSIPMFIMGRYFNYFGLFGIIAISKWISSKIYYRKRRFKVKPIYWVLILIPLYFMYFQSYMAPANKSGTLKTYMIYYPYVTRFNPEMIPQREEIYRYNNAR